MQHLHRRLLAHGEVLDAIDRAHAALAELVRDPVASVDHPADQHVVVDKNLVTSRKPADIPVFIRESLKLLEKVPVGAR